MSFVSRYLDPTLVEKLNHLSLPARRVVEGTISGEHKGPFKGASVEFRQHRFYVPGDELRRLDWRVLGRTDRPYIKEYDQETNLRCLLMLDASGSMAYAGKGMPTKFDYACRLVAAIAYLLLANTEHVGLAVFGAGIEKWVGPRSDKGQLPRILDTLDQVAPHGPADPARALHQAADRLGRRSLALIFSDFLAPAERLKEGLKHLGHDRHEMILMRVLDRDEIEFPFRDTRLMVGMESDGRLLCEPAVTREAYLENFRRHADQLQELCRPLSAELANFVTDEPVAESAPRFLRRREIALH